MVLKTKKGFTLIEMMIVLGIISILALISVVALIANTNYQRLSKSAEEIVTLMRVAQNRSNAIVMDGASTKAWEFVIDSTTYKIKALNVDSGPGTTLTESLTDIPSNDQGSLPAGTAVATSYYYNDVLVPPDGGATFYSFFSTPFARTYLSSALPAGPDCAWKNGSLAATARVAKDWYVDPTSCVSVYSPAHPGYANIKLTYKNNVITIKVNTNGDISFQ